MKKSKLKILPVILLLLLTSMFMFTSIQKSTALPNDFKDIRDGYKGHLIRVYNHETMVFTTSEASHVYHGWTGLTKQDLRDLDPLEVKIFLDGVEIDLETCEEKIKIGDDKTYNVWFYQTFNTGFFTPGIYNWTVVWSDVTGVIYYQSHPLVILSEPHRLSVFNTDSLIITNAERSFVKHGWAGVTEEEKENLEPMNVQVLLDGAEIELYPIVEEIEEEVYNLHFYQYFDAYYFAPGIYNWTVVWSDVTGIVLKHSYPLIVLNEPHRINLFNENSMTIAASERSYVINGWQWTPEDIENGVLYESRPLEYKLFIDEQEVELYQKLETDFDEFGDLETYSLRFYQYFDNYYFEPGIYNITGVWYLNSEINHVQSNPLIVLVDSHRLRLLDSSDAKVNEESLIINSADRCYISHGWLLPVDDTGYPDLYAETPLDFKFYIDDQEIELYQKIETTYDELGNPTSQSLRFYRNFETGYFVPGIYNITGVWTSATDSLTNSYPLIVLDDSHRLILFDPISGGVVEESLIITTSERCFIKHGWHWTPENIGDSGFYDERPFDFRLYIDDQEIELYQKIERYYDELGNPTDYILYFYQNFDAYFFEPGIYNITGVWTSATESITNSHPLIVLGEGHRLSILAPQTLRITTLERSFIQHGVTCGPEYLYDPIFYEQMPYDVQLFVDGYEIDLYQRVEIGYDEFGEIASYRFLHYQHFDSYYFSPIDYELTVVWTSADEESFSVTRTLSVQDEGHRISMFQPETWTILDSESSYVKHGWSISVEEFGNEEFYESRPYEFQLEVDGQLVEVYQNFEILYDEFGEISEYLLTFYLVFDEYFFLPGTYVVIARWIEGDGDYYEALATLEITSS